MLTAHTNTLLRKGRGSGGVFLGEDETQTCRSSGTMVVNESARSIISCRKRKQGKKYVSTRHMPSEKAGAWCSNLEF